MKKYVYRFLGIVLLVIVFTMGWNYTFDTTGLFNQDFSVKREEPNQHFVKVRYILSNKNRYNAFCFGSSRVGNIDLEKINNELHYYNMTYSVGLPDEWFEDLQTFIKHGVKIKQVIIGLDDFSFRINPNAHKTDWLRLPYNDNDKFNIYLSYLLRMPNKPHNSTNKGSIYDIYGSGRPLHEEVDKEIEAHIEQHINDPKFRSADISESYRLAETIHTIQQIKELCLINNIQLIVFINPIHCTTYLGNNLQQFNEFKYELAKVIDYYDFSGLNDITTNNYYYYETNHYRPLVGDMIVERLFHGGNNDFGFYVTNENVAEHLRALEIQVQQR